MTATLSAENVHKSYRRFRPLRGCLRRDQRVALAGVSMQVQSGEAVGLLGPNGSGKTTFLKAALGLITVDAGQITVMGTQVHRGLGAAARDVGAVIDPVQFMPSLSARTTLALLARAAQLPAGRVNELLERVGLLPHADRPVRTLSLGMRQRLALAAALLRRPSLLLLDEPANGLDPAGAHQLRQFLTEFVAGGGSVVVSSHALADLQSLVTRVVVLNGGQVIYDGQLESLCRAQHRWYVAIEEPVGYLITALAGYHLTPERAGVIVEGARAPGEISRAVTSAGCTLTELRPLEAGLEQRYLELIGDELESAWGT